MFCKCCLKLHRYQVHLISRIILFSYGCISFFLIASGLIFTIFSVFQKDTQIGKVWLAGPTTMVVGLVLCGKVVIDWGPAMHQSAMWDRRPEYEQIPGTNIATSDNSNVNSMLGNNTASLGPDTTAFANMHNHVNYDISNDSQDTLEHKASSNTTYLQASSSSVSSPPTGPMLSYYHVSSRYQSAELQLSMEKDCRKLASIRHPEETLIATDNRNCLSDDNVCICSHLSVADFSVCRKAMQKQHPLTVSIGGRSPTNSMTTTLADIHVNGAYQGETFVLNNHSYLI